MTPPTRRRRAGLAVAIGLALAASGCGTTTLNTVHGAAASATAVKSVAIPEVQADPTLAAMVPAAMQKAGILADGSDASYPPDEFFGSDNTTIVGMDIDLLTAVAQKLGLKVKFTNADFGTIIGGINSGKYDIGISSFTVNSDREKRVNMVQYYSAGISWAARPGTNVDPANMCGRTVAVQTSTVEVDDTQALSKRCRSAGKAAIKIVSETAQTKVAADVMAGKADAMSADTPVTAYAITQSHGQLEHIGNIYGTAPYGIVVDKPQTKFAQAISQALVELHKDGVYDAILDKWGLKAGAVTSFPVNPSAS